MAQQFYQALAQALSTGVTFAVRTGRSNGRKSRGSPVHMGGKVATEPRDTLKTAVWLKSHHRARVAGLRTLFSFNNAWKSHKNAVDSRYKKSLGIEYIIKYKVWDDSYGVRRK